jgi:dTDP-4-amino-4,6-dideoxygalactose transaminase
MLNCSNPGREYEALKSQIREAVLRVLDKGHYVLGEEVELFEKEFAAYVGASQAVGVASGTDALHLALRACKVGPGDEVITVSHTAVATVAAIEMAGAKPVLVDIDPIYYTIDVGAFEKAITPRTRAVIPVHLYGQPADMERICAIAREHRISVIEDCCQAHGASLHGRKVGSWGDVGCFSFYPTKNIGGVGDGGMIVTAKPALADGVRSLREYGWKERYVSEVPGFNSRLDELQAAILRVKLRHLDEHNGMRLEAAEEYQRCLAPLGLTVPEARPGATHVFHLYVIRLAKREELRSFLKGREINALVHYPVPVHLQPAYRDGARVPGMLKRSEQAAREVLTLPLYPYITWDELGRVVSAIKEFLGEAHD